MRYLNVDFGARSAYSNLKEQLSTCSNRLRSRNISEDSTCQIANISRRFKFETIPDYLLEVARIALHLVVDNPAVGQLRMLIIARNDRLLKVASVKSESNSSKGHVLEKTAG